MKGGKNEKLTFIYCQPATFNFFNYKVKFTQH